MTTYESTNDFYQEYAEAPPSSRGGFSIFFVLIPLTVAVFAYFLMNFSSSLQSVFFMSINSESPTISTDNSAFIDVPDHISPLFSPSVRHWETQIIRWSSDRNLDPNLVATLIQIESCGDPKAESYAGAASLFQVMPFHFKDTEDPFDVETNAYRGLNYLELALDTSDGDVGLAFAGYNGGIGVIGLNSSEWAEQTRNYQYWAENIYADVQQGSDETLQEWLGAGGHSLCKQAENRLIIASSP